MTAASDVVAAGSSAITEATWFYSPDATTPMRMTCAASGDVSDALGAQRPVSLSGMSDFVSCPGSPVADDSIDIMIQ